MLLPHSLAILSLLLPAITCTQVLLVDGVYQGSVSESGGLVEVIPKIKAKNGPICGFRIVNSRKGKIPFEVFMLDQEAGTAQLKARHPLNCEQKKLHIVSIAAVSCSGEISESVDVEVRVTDVNEYIPEWSQEEYSGQVEEGVMAEFILQVTARDKDCSPTFGDICQYSITSPEQPFQISETGVITNSQPLSSAESRSHVISVVATDCGGKESSPVLVTITVLPICKNEWTDVSTSMTYIPGTGPQPTFPVAQLRVCPSLCPLDRLETRLTLHTQHPAETCDRDTYSLDMMRKMCGASNMAVELLPTHSDKENSWVSDLPTGRDREAGPVYQFEGRGEGGVVVPESVLHHDLGQEFTISTWMKHEAKTSDKHQKEHLLCLADDHRKNRHHTALFVRNCKLVLLYRRDYEEQERNVFKPAEWRWSVPQVCDNTWHHYAVSLSQEGAQLYLDGELWQAQQNNPEIIDDWPLHPAADIKTTLTVGGCWNGSDRKMKHMLRGYLAGLSVLPGRREHSEVLKCLVQCSESLQLPATNLLQPGMEMVTNSHGSQVTIDGDNVDNMNQLVRQVAYLNTREFPVSGKRKLELETTLICKDGTSRKVPSAVSTVLVMTIPQPIITITGTENISKEYEGFKAGVRVFSGLTISVSQGGSDSEREEIDKCSISVFPPLNPDHEEMNLPKFLLKSLKLLGSVTEEGVEVSGQNKISNYQAVLRELTYTNMKPAYYLNRQFKLICSQQGSRFTSNEFVQTLSVIHPPPETVGLPVLPAHRELSPHSVEQAGPRLSSHLQGQQGHLLLALVILSVSLLIVVLVVGVVRLRASSRRQLREEQEVEMAWDDAALNITVNPLEDADESGVIRSDKLLDTEMYQDSSDEEMFGEETSDDDDDDDDEDDDDDSPVRHRLEWDDGL